MIVMVALMTIDHSCEARGQTVPDQSLHGHHERNSSMLLPPPAMLQPFPEAKWLQRMIFLETVAGVPGMVAGMLRHLKSLRTMERDYGW